MTKSQSKGEKQVARVKKTATSPKSKARVTLGPAPAFSGPPLSPSKASSSSSVGPQSSSKKGRSPANPKKPSDSSSSSSSSSLSSHWPGPLSSAKPVGNKESPELDNEQNEEEHTEKTSIVIFSPSQKSQGDSQLPSFSSSSSAAATSSYPFSIVTNEQVPSKAYSFEYLTLLNESSGEVSNVELRDQLVHGSKRVLDGLILADNNLKRYFFEMIVVAYKLKITSPEGLVNLLKHTWRVRLSLH